MVASKDYFRTGQQSLPGLPIIFFLSCLPLHPVTNLFSSGITEVGLTANIQVLKRQNARQINCTRYD